MPYVDLKKRAERWARYYAAHREEKRVYDKAYRAANRERIRARHKAYLAANPEKKRLWAINSRASKAIYDRVTTYGITAEWLTEMFDAQEQCCAICGRDITLQKAHVDHDHTTGVARALLCAWCNTRLAAVENPSWLDSAQSYLAVFA